MCGFSKAGVYVCMWRRGGVSIDEVPVSDAWRSEFQPHPHVTRPEKVAYAWNLRIGKEETGGFLSLSGQLAQPKW